MKGLLEKVTRNIDLLDEELPQVARLIIAERLFPVKVIVTSHKCKDH
jgi:hypothetical protein